MSRRGSAQLLLLFFRSRARLGWTLGAIVGVLVVAGLQAGGDFPILTRLGIAQMIRQSAWHQALAGLPEQEAGLVGLGIALDEDVQLWRRDNPLDAGGTV